MKFTKRDVDAALAHARELIAGGWTQRAFAKATDGRQLHWAEPAACRFCLSGAMQRAAYQQAVARDPNVTEWEWQHLDDLMHKRLPADARGRPSFNDAPGRTQQDVLDVLTCAIETKA